VKLVIFGLSVTSSWGNGHATLWRSLIRALRDRGHQVVFFERDLPFYAAHRDMPDLPGGGVRLYESWDSIAVEARRQMRDADVAMVTSFCPDGPAASDLVCDSAVPVRCFYDLDTPVTLAQLSQGEPPAYIGDRGLRDFDLVLSFTGGRALNDLQERLGARRVVPIYGSVDPEVYRPVAPHSPRAALSYLGTYAADRQPALDRFFLEPARLRHNDSFVIGGAQYPANFPWLRNIYFHRHVAPPAHPAFYAAARLTLNLPRRAMAEMGHCPSGRLFEAAACGAPIVTDWWKGLDEFFAPGRELVVARETKDVLLALDLSDAELAAMAGAARERTLAQHSAARRAKEMENAFASISHARPDAPRAAAPQPADVA
jgi:spore maturation protein CgeB